MTDAKMRDVAFWDVDLAWDKRPDGSILVWQKGELGSYPDRLSDKIKHWAEATPDQVWMAERGPDGEWIKVTYRQMYRMIRSIGQVMLDLNLSTERPLLILSENSIEHGLIALGAQYVGVPSAAIAPAYCLMSSDYAKLKSIAEQITPGAIFAKDVTPFTPAIDAIFDDTTPVLTITEGQSAVAWGDMISKEPNPDVEVANAATGPDTVAKFMFTSGTTGSPKAVIQTQRMLCSNQEMALDCYDYLRTDPPIVVDWAPWNHVASGSKVFNMVLYSGGSFYLDAGKPSPKMVGETIRNLREISPNWYFNVPAGYEMLVEAMNSDPTLRKSFFKNLKLMMYAGAAMAVHTWDELERMAVETTGERVFMSTGLGSTETAPFALFSTEAQDEPGNIGVPAKGITLKLVPNDDKLEARLTGPNVTPGYWRNPEMTAGAFDDEGYYCLGDALRFADPNDPAKGFFFDGRIAENFKLSTGTWVGVGPLRAKLTDALGGVARDVVITGEGRERLGALLVPFRPAMERLVEGGEAMSDADLYAHPNILKDIAENLAKYSKTAPGSSTAVKRAIILVAPLDLDKGEVTDKGSVNQRAVLRHRADLVETLFSNDPRVILAKEA